MLEKVYQFLLLPTYKCIAKSRLWCKARLTHLYMTYACNPLPTTISR